MYNKSSLNKDSLKTLNHFPHIKCINYLKLGICKNECDKSASFIFMTCYNLICSKLQIYSISCHEAAEEIMFCTTESCI